MSQDILTLDCSTSGALERLEFDLQDLESTRLVLNGESIIDWHRLDLDTIQKVDRFLALHMLDVEDPLDRERLRFLFNESVNYLEENHRLALPPELRDPADVREIFLVASDTRGFRRRQILACAILKLMHVINHMEAADLKFQTSVSESHLIELAERRVVAMADQMRQEGFPLLAFYGSRKTRSSVITKLLVKTEAHATTIFDKLRFRIITETPDHILPAIVWLTRHIVPFNYVIPGQSHNNLRSFAAMLSAARITPGLVGQLQFPLKDEPLTPEPNPFSGSTYRMVNFIADFPVRLDPFLTDLDPVQHLLLGRIVYVTVEFQILDADTAAANEVGENAHARYKARQRRIVAKRLKRGGLERARARDRRAVDAAWRAGPEEDGEE
ncbi:MAG: TIGR04552 family protein [Pseudomonadota bacterium]